VTGSSALLHACYASMHSCKSQAPLQQHSDTTQMMLPLHSRMYLHDSVCRVLGHAWGQAPIIMDGAAAGNTSRSQSGYCTHHSARNQRKRKLSGALITCTAACRLLIVAVLPTFVPPRRP
jgi:hypothetical protein